MKGHVARKRALLRGHLGRPRLRHRQERRSWHAAGRDRAEGRHSPPDWRPNGTAVRCTSILATTDPSRANSSPAVGLHQLEIQRRGTKEP
jgi:hypothetical protein